MAEYRYCISLRITHPIVDPKEITREIGLEPHVSWKVGDPRISPKGTSIGGIRKESYWTAHPHTEKRLHSKNMHLEEYIEKLTSDLKTHKEYFAEIRSGGGNIEYFIGLFGAGNIGNVFVSDLLSEIGGLGIDLSFDIYAGEE